MAKKTEKNNKTKHVLSLLTAERDSHAQENETQERKAEPTTPASVVAGEKQESAPSVTVIDSNERMQDQLSEMIGEELERELEEERQEDGEQNAELAAAENRKTGNAQPDAAAKEDAVDTGAEETGTEADEGTISGETATEEPSSEEPVSGTVEETASRETAAAEEAGAEKQEIKESVSDAAPAEQTKDTDYVFFNVMKAVVEDGLEENLKRFDACSCPRCRMDAMAMALNRLAPKYVVVARGAVSALKDVYEKKYMADTLVAVVQACIEVAKKPRH